MIAMGVFFSYSIYSSILLAILYLAYKWVLSAETYHRFNRGVLWSIYIMAFGTFPVGNILRRALSTSGTIGEEIIPVIDVGDMTLLGMTEPEVAFPWMFLLIGVYMAGIVAVVGYTFMVGLQLARIIRKGERMELDGTSLILIDREGIAPFSCFGMVVMSRLDYEEVGEMVLLHELSHVRLHHWMDLLFAQIVCSFQWFNPAAWLMREEFKTVHEYQADHGVLAAGANAREYQMLLIKKAVGARFPSLANSLNHSKLKKRITMMYNSKASPARRLRVLALRLSNNQKLDGLFFCVEVLKIRQQWEDCG